MNSKMILVIFSLLSVALWTSEAILGGWNDLDVEDPGLSQAVSEGFQLLKSGINSNGFVKLGQVVSAQSQVVNGLKYKAVVTVDHKECENTRCAVMKSQNCTLVVWHKAVENSYEVESHTCDRAVIHPLSANRMMGGTFPRDSEEESLKEVARYSLEYLQNATNSPKELTFVRILNATSQVVAGTVYRMVVEFSAQGGPEPQDVHPVICYFKVFRGLHDGSVVQKFDCDDNAFIL